KATFAMAVSSTSMNAASETVTAINQGLAAGRQIACSALSEIVALIAFSLRNAYMRLASLIFQRSSLPSGRRENQGDRHRTRAPVSTCGIDGCGGEDQYTGDGLPFCAWAIEGGRFDLPAHAQDGAGRWMFIS